MKKKTEKDEFMWRELHEAFKRYIKTGDCSFLTGNGQPHSLHKRMEEITEEQQPIIVKHHWEAVFSFGIYADDYDEAKKGNDTYMFLGGVVDSILEHIPKSNQSDDANGNLIIGLKKALFNNQRIYYGDEYCVEIIYDRAPLFATEGMCAVLIEKHIGDEHIFPKETIEADETFEGIEPIWSDPYERERFNRIIDGDDDDSGAFVKMPKFFDKDGNPKDSTQNRVIPYFGEGQTEIAKRYSIPIILNK